MCGRFVLVRLAEFTDLFPWIRTEGVDYPPRYNIAPTQPVPVVINDHGPRLDVFRWGLVPSWAKDIAIGNKLLNARAETLSEKPAFRTLLKRKRCLIPASGFYEWRRDGRVKTPMYIRLKSRRPFALAGLWDVWHSPDGSELPTCTVITTAPNELMQTIHDRMPVLLDEPAMQRWLAPTDDRHPPADVLRAYDAGAMEAYSVGSRVNSPAFDAASLIEPAASESLFG